eukprot:g41781.t1
MQHSDLHIYTDWANHYLAKSGHKQLIRDLQQDVRDGVLLAEIIQVVAAGRPAEFLQHFLYSFQILMGLDRLDVECTSLVDYSSSSLKLCTCAVVPCLPHTSTFGHLVWRVVLRLEQLLPGLTRLVMNRSRQGIMRGVISANCLPLFRSYLRVHVSFEREHVVPIIT